MITGSCHCGAVTWRFEGEPETATSCNCSVCRRYGSLWVYGFEGADVSVAGPTTTYLQGDCTLAFHFCPACHCLMYWRGLAPRENGLHRLGVNIRMADASAVAHIPLRRLDGLDTWDELETGGRRVEHLWF